MSRNHLSPPVFPHAWSSDWGQDQYGLWQAFNYKNIRYAFRWIPPGSFMMGSPEDEDGRLESEDLHHVTLTQGFWLGETTVTQALWKAVMDDDPSEFKDEQLPVEEVSWNDCQGFIVALKVLHSDLNVGLPSEAQWEYACRAGSTTPFHFGGKDDLTLYQINYLGQRNGSNLNGKTEVVKSFPCNDWGLYEMHGNVFEWCEDAWKESLGKVSVIDPVSNLESDLANSELVVRGGSWRHNDSDCRSAIRYSRGSDDHYNNIGFRLFLSQ